MDVQVGDIIKLENNQFVTVGVKVAGGRSGSDGCLSEGSFIRDRRQSPRRYASYLSGGADAEALLFRPTSCCCPAASRSTWSTWKRPSWTGESSSGGAWTSTSSGSTKTKT